MNLSDSGRMDCSNLYTDSYVLANLQDIVESARKKIDTFLISNLQSCKESQNLQSISFFGYRVKIGEIVTEKFLNLNRVRVPNQFDVPENV